MLEPKTQRGVGTSQKIQKQEFRIELQVVCEQFVEFYLKAKANSRFCRGPQSQIRKQKLFLLVSEVRSLKKLYKTTSGAENHERVKLSQRS